MWLVLCSILSKSCHFDGMVKEMIARNASYSLFCLYVCTPYGYVDEDEAEDSLVYPTNTSHSP